MRDSVKPVESSLLLQSRDSTLTTTPLAAPPPPPAPQPAARPSRSVRPTATVRREDSVVNSLRVAALAAMRRALDAGATPTDLARGDTMLHGADSLTAQGRSADAMIQLVSATSAWNEAERAARARAARDTVRPAPPPPPVAAVVPQPVAPPVDPRVQIEAAIANYARALESRDTAQVRRANPGLTAAQEKGWEDLFKAVRNLKATLRVATIDVKSGTADVLVNALYEFDNATTGRVERRPGTFHASFVSDSAGWRLNAIH